MDEQRFDAALRALGTGTTRRRGLAAAFGILFGTTAITYSARKRSQPAADEQAGKSDKDQSNAEGPCGDGSGKANRCTKDSQCCTGYCKKSKGGKTGRCRCLKRGKPCTAKQTCCKGLACANGACVKSKPTPTPVPGQPTATPIATATATPGCGPATCSGGCCNAGTCVLAQDHTDLICGMGGVACFSCAPGFCTGSGCGAG
jgi:hypothetical protein